MHPVAVAVVLEVASFALPGPVAAVFLVANRMTRSSAVPSTPTALYRSYLFEDLDIMVGKGCGAEVGWKLQRNGFPIWRKLLRHVRRNLFIVKAVEFRLDGCGDSVPRQSEKEYNLGQSHPSLRQP